jgi:hypothetical protein
MRVCFVKNSVDREWIFLYYNQKDYCKDDEWKSSYIEYLQRAGNGVSQ